jgi:hypothetical protein
LKNEESLHDNGEVFLLVLPRGYQVLSSSVEHNAVIDCEMLTNEQLHAVNSQDVCLIIRTSRVRELIIVFVH